MSLAYMHSCHRTSPMKPLYTTAGLIKWGNISLTTVSCIPPPQKKKNAHNVLDKAAKLDVLCINFCEDTIKDCLILN